MKNKKKVPFYSSGNSVPWTKNHYYSPKKLLTSLDFLRFIPDGILIKKNLFNINQPVFPISFFIE